MAVGGKRAHAEFGGEAKGIEILGRQDEDYGRFAWIMDPDGVKVELWQQLGPAPE